MGIKNIWIKDELFARSINRTIDKSTMLDLLAIVIYEANRTEKLEDAGFLDQASSMDCLFSYVLDALDIPPESENFSREPFESLFYEEYWLDNKIEPLDMVLAKLEELRDETNKRLANVDLLRSSFQVVPKNDN